MTAMRWYCQVIAKDGERRYGESHSGVVTVLIGARQIFGYSLQVAFIFPHSGVGLQPRFSRGYL
jgi:hypothetical protein